jgi:acyl carrier protein
MTEQVRQRLAELVAAATEGEVPAAQVLAGGRSLRALGVGSLAFLRLVDAVEAEFGVELDLDTPGLDTLDGLAARVTAP